MWPLAQFDWCVWGTCADSYPVVSQSLINITGRSVVFCSARTFCSTRLIQRETTGPYQRRPQSLRYHYPAERATDALWKNWKPEPWNPGSGLIAPCVKFFSHLTKRSCQGNFVLLVHWYTIVPKQFLFKWPLIYVSRDLKGLLRKPKNL